jgi:3-phosphoshikimate 1-carboxyvinyltransferase
MNDRLEIVPLTKPPCATILVPGSKSITNRALVLAALHSRGQECFLGNVLTSEDTEVMQRALCQLGFDLFGESCVGGLRISSGPETDTIPVREADLFVANSGTTMRFLTAIVCLGHGRYRLDGIPRMRERPIEDLLAALQQLGVKAFSERENGCPPVVVEADGLRGGSIRVKGDVSSQFLSALLLVAPSAEGHIDIEVTGDLVSRPYVDMSVAMLRQWGLIIHTPSNRLFHIPGRQRGTMRNYQIEPDASAASYFLGAAAITSGRITLPYLSEQSLQGDMRFANILGQMGCVLGQERGWPFVQGGPLRGIDVDMNDISDTVMTLAAVACFAEGPTTIRNVAHIRHKETDRLAALATELRRVGAEVEEFDDGLTITPRSLHGAEIETYNDHRMAMSMALIGLRVPGIVIKNPGCVAKTYPHFFTDLERLRGESREDKS